MRFAFLLLFLLPCFLLAQSTGVISGTVEDTTGAVIPAASVTAVQQQTSQRFDALTDDQGRFSFARLPVGNYQVEATRQGFRRFVSEVIRLDADQTRQAGIVLQVGETTESVEVTGAISLVETVG